MSRLGRLFIMLTITTALLAGGRAAAAAPPTASAAKACGGFTTADYRYKVSATGGLSCTSASRLVKSFIRSHSSWREHGDGTSAGTYYTNAKFKGWRCGEGSGGGACWRGDRYANYENSNL
jgi:hypothetical protein